MQAEGAGTAGTVCTQDPRERLAGRACYELVVSLVACFLQESGAHLVMPGYPNSCAIRVTRHQVQDF
jgi:hypothetical protein